MINNIDKITVLIVGNPDAQAGESVLLDINSSPLNSNELGKIFYESITSDYYIELIHGEEYISCTYVANPSKVHSSGSNRPGVFWIGVTIPKGKQLEKTYDMIMEIKNKFQKLYMTILSDDSYEFKNIDYSAGEIKEIVDRYKLVDSQSKYICMSKESNNISIVNLTSDNSSYSNEDKIKMFLDDTQYNEFKDSSSIIVVNEIVSVSGKINVEVPRLREYIVVCDNGYDIGPNQKVDNRNNQCFKGVLRKDDYHENIEISFELKELSNGVICEKEDRCGHKYTLEKTIDEVLVKGDFKPKDFKVGVKSCDNCKEDIKDHINNFKIYKSNDRRHEFKVYYDDGFGHYIEFKGNQIDTEIIVEKCVEKCPYEYKFKNGNKIKIGKETTTLDVDIVKFNKIILTEIPQDTQDNNRQVIIKSVKEEYTHTINNTYNGGKSDINVDDIDKGLAWNEIRECKFNSEIYEGLVDKNAFEYDEKNGILTIRINAKKKDKVKEKGTSHKESVNDRITNEKRIIRIINKIENSTFSGKIIIDKKEYEIIEIINNTNKKGNQIRPERDIEIDKDVKKVVVEGNVREKVENKKYKGKGGVNDREFRKEIDITNIQRTEKGDKTIYDIEITDEWLNNSDEDSPRNKKKSFCDFKSKEFRNGFLFGIISTVSICAILAIIYVFVNKTYESDEQKIKCSAYYELMKKCSEDLTFDTVNYINKWVTETTSLSSDEKYGEIKKYIGIYVNAVQQIENKNIDSVFYATLNNDFCKQMKECINPLAGKDEDSKIFIKLINNATVKFNVISFYDVNKLYIDSKGDIKNFKEQQKQQKQCSAYYELMKECSKDLTFDTVSYINKWVTETTSLSSYKEYGEIKKYVGIYVDAAEAIKYVRENYCGKGGTFAEYDQSDQ